MVSLETVLANMAHGVISMGGAAVMAFGLWQFLLARAQRRPAPARWLLLCLTGFGVSALPLFI